MYAYCIIFYFEFRSLIGLNMDAIESNMCSKQLIDFKSRSTVYISIAGAINFAFNVLPTTGSSLTASANLIIEDADFSSKQHQSPKYW